MKIKYTIGIVFLSFCSIAFSQSNKQDSLMFIKLYEEAMLRGKSYENLEILCNTVGHRLTGSPQAEKAVELTRKMLKEAKADSVFLQPVKVPHWVRGKKESARIILAIEDIKSINNSNAISPATQKIIATEILALGGSIATPPDGLRGNVVEIKNLKEWDKIKKNQIEGKIVFFNQPMNPKTINTFDAYGPAVKQRSMGAIMAAKLGAIAVIVRSVTLANDNNPHTGAMRYNDSIPKIPACAISTKGADMLSKFLMEEPDLEFEFFMACQTLPDVMSNNVVAEIRADKNSPVNTEYIVSGGHLDSWDVGEGAHDDGAGCMQTIEALRILKAVGYIPKRTLRFVMFMNEENGLKGGEEYAKLAKKNNEKHIAGIESDAGGFAPDGFSFEATEKQKEKLKTFWKNFMPYGLHDFDRTGGGADISPLKEQGTALFEMMPESQRYFDYHHCDLDTFDKVNKRELEQGAFSMAALIYLISEYGL
jgi:carboxypeptidase Q